MNKYWKFYGIILGVFAIVTLAFSQKSSTDEFLNKAYMSNQYEVAAAKLASEKSSNESIKAFASMMIDDHQKLLTELEALATAESITLTEGLDSEHQARWDMLNKREEAAFDETYKADAIANHEQAIALFEQASGDQTIENEALKNWIIMKIPALKAHLDKANVLEVNTAQEVEIALPVETTGTSEME